MCETYVTLSYEALHYWIVGRDCRPVLDQTNLIDWKRLSEVIRENENGPMGKQFLSNYEAHMDEKNPTSIVSLMTRQPQSIGNSEKAKDGEIPQHSFYYRFDVDQLDNYHDLIDLAEAIYQQRIDVYKKYRAI